MTGSKFLLLDVLIRLAKREEVPIEGADLEDIVRACFLFVASPSVETCPRAERIGYEEYEGYTNEESGVSETLRGLSLPGSELLLTDMIRGLMQEKSIPPALKDACPDLSYEDYVAGLWAIMCILHALVWSSFDTPSEQQYSEERTRRFIAKTIEQLREFRTTGEL
ncbi:hypothetical protein LVJ94_00375 [Pendulispora rubella]|uniref:Uncharacterized protein n=1 Tax=Pendulispora rubella TaxID=2741070 RepID=A0ABZ2L468_9BACT